MKNTDEIIQALGILTVYPRGKKFVELFIEIPEGKDSEALRSFIQTINYFSLRVRFNSHRKHYYFHVKDLKRSKFNTLRLMREKNPTLFANGMFDLEGVIKKESFEELFPLKN